MFGVASSLSPAAFPIKLSQRARFGMNSKSFEFIQTTEDDFLKIDSITLQPTSSPTSLALEAKLNHLKEEFLANNIKLGHSYKNKNLEKTAKISFMRELLEIVNTRTIELGKVYSPTTHNLKITYGTAKFNKKTSELNWEQTAVTNCVKNYCSFLEGRLGNSDWNQATIDEK